MYDNWDQIFKELEKSPEYLDIQDFLSRRAKDVRIYPDFKDLFKPFLLTPFNNIRVVIIGQDPYFDGNADGLAFSCKNKLSPSLRKIYEKLRSEYDPNYKFNIINLNRWAEQGVLLLNSVLTVEAGKPNSHSNIGWTYVTDKIIEAIAKSKSGVILFTMGKKFKSF